MVTLFFSVFIAFWSPCRYFLLILIPFTPEVHLLGFGKVTAAKLRILSLR